MTTLDPQLDTLVQKDLIRDLIFAYARAVDRLDYDALDELYYPDAQDEHGFNPEGTYRDFVSTLKVMYTGASAIQHCISNIYIKLDGDYAEAESYLLNTQHIHGPDGPYRMVAGGRYHDKIERRGGVWKFRHRRLAMDWANAMSSTNDLDHQTVTGLVKGAVGAEDPGYDFFRLFKRGKA